MLFGEEGTLDIKQGGQENDYSWHGHFGEQESLAIIGLEWEHAFPHVEKTLWNPDTEQGLGFLGIVAG